MKYLFKAVAVCSATIFFVACGGPSEPKQPDLSKQPDRWVSSIEISANSSVKFVGETRDYLVTTVSSVDALDGVQVIRIGDEVGGLKIGAIKCSFHWKDSSYGGEQYMWRGRWACMAGRTKQEVLSAVGPNGEKHHSYIHASPITISESN